MNIKKNKKGESLSSVPTSNGYGFVCFKEEKDALKAKQAGKIEGLEGLTINAF
jgi:RNA recognition motif-containing protein